MSTLKPRAPEPGRFGVTITVGFDKRYAEISG